MSPSLTIPYPNGLSHKEVQNRVQRLSQRFCSAASVMSDWERAIADEDFETARKLLRLRIKNGILSPGGRGEWRGRIGTEDTAQKDVLDILSTLAAIGKPTIPVWKPSETADDLVSDEIVDLGEEQQGLLRQTCENYLDAARNGFMTLQEAKTFIENIRDAFEGFTIANVDSGLLTDTLRQHWTAAFTKSRTETDEFLDKLASREMNVEEIVQAGKEAYRSLLLFNATGHVWEDTVGS